jgi:hypothetical protein
MAINPCFEIISCIPLSPGSRAHPRRYFHDDGNALQTAGKVYHPDVPFAKLFVLIFRVMGTASIPLQARLNIPVIHGITFA